MTQKKVEVGQYREVNKGTLKAFFSLVIYPEGQKIIDCRYFVHGEQRWFSFPQKEIKKTDGSKSEFIPYISFINKTYLEELKKNVMEQVILAEKEYKNTAPHANKNVAEKVQDQSPVDWL